MIRMGASHYGENGLYRGVSEMGQRSRPPYAVPILWTGLLRTGRERCVWQFHGIRLCANGHGTRGGENHDGAGRSASVRRPVVSRENLCLSKPQPLDSLTVCGRME